MKKTNKNLVGLVVSAVVLLSAPLVGVTVTVFVLHGTFRERVGADLDPSEKARLLGEGISGAMDGTAFALAISCIALVPVVFFGVRLHRDSKRRPPTAEGDAPMRESSRAPLTVAVRGHTHRHAAALSRGWRRHPLLPQLRGRSCSRDGWPVCTKEPEDWAPELVVAEHARRLADSFGAPS